MKAWQYIGNQTPIQMNEVDSPTPSPTQVVLSMRAAGLCHSDVMYMGYGERAMAYVPMTMGHENAGVITALGSDVTGFEVGDVVGVCPSGVQLPAGMFTDGGFAEEMVADFRDLARVPDGLDLSLAALATDAGMTSYHAVIKVGGATLGTKVGIIGFGGLGQIGARAAVLAGAEVHVAETKQDVWKHAEEAGVTSCVADAAEWATQGDFDLVVDYAGFDTTQKALDAIKRGGKVVQVGLGQPTLTLNTNSLLGKTIEGSLGGTVEDIEELYALMVDGEITPVYEEIAFDAIGEGLEKLKNHQVTGRLVARFGD